MIVLGFAMFGGLFFLYNPAEVVERLHGVNWALAMPIVTGLAGMHLLQVELWRLMSHALNGRRLRRGAAVRAYFVGQALGGITPCNIGADFYRTIAVKTGSTSWREAAVPVLGQRIVSYAASSFLALVAGYLSVAANQGLLFLASVVMALALAALWSQRHGLMKLARQSTSRLTPGLAGLLSRAARVYRPTLALGFGFHLGSVGLMYALLLSIGETPPLPATIGLLLVARAVSLLPITPYGLGLQEGSLVLLLPSLGVGPESALALSLLARLGTVVVVSLGLGCFLLQRFGSGTRAHRWLPT
jgi:uncharacterized protein (TIRG00374 family)